VAPAACRGSTADAPSGEVHLTRGLNAPSGGIRLARELNAPSGAARLARGLNAPSGEVRLARGLNAPSARTTSLEGTGTHVVPAPAPVYEHLMLRHHGTRATTLTRLGITLWCCSTDSLGKAIPATM
jgi:hypothetical protein